MRILFEKIEIIGALSLDQPRISRLRKYCWA